MTKRMLIDASHAEETRVAVVDANRLVDYDYESKVRKQLKGSIFLAKVTRVEPSLQAAFVNFGGNRHGFLPFSDIHPDYYRIPIADREALLAEQERELEEKARREEAEDKKAEDGDSKESSDEAEEAEDDDEEDDDDVEEVGGEFAVSDEDREEEDKKEEQNKKGKKGRRRRSSRSKRVETVGGDSNENEAAPRRSVRRNYKIQEVIKRGQIMLIQVSKEERGNKGAAVTTLLSLPGRYCVLMPNSPRSGGVSRKIENYKDRKRMREILKEMEVPKGMSVIMRTSAVSRNKTEVKRDLDYLTRLWDSIRETTLSSTAPALIHEEGNLIRRSIRDIYTRDVKEILVAGEDGYAKAKDFVKMMVPSHARRVKEYKEERIPLFHRYKVEGQISEMGGPRVTLPSGGYIIINPTEALVAVDVNSGRSTKGRHIEETALKTNLEAAEEVARQLRLRDLGGLIVIDFIDMEDRRNNRKVENATKKALSQDRARIQVGRISSFGLLELSRQRLNPSLTEAQFEKCSQCKGVGLIRTIDSAAVLALRALEEEGVKGHAKRLVLLVPDEVALYILNNKREMIADIEKRYQFTVEVKVDTELEGTDFVVDVTQKQSSSGKKDDKDDKDDKDKKDEKSADNNNKKGGRRRGRRGGRRRSRSRQNDENPGQKQSEENQKDDKKESASNKDSSKDTNKTSSNKKDASDDKDKKSSGKNDKPETKDDADDKKKKSAASKKSPSKSKKGASKKKTDDKKSDPAPPKKTDDNKKTSASNDAKPEKDYEVVNEPPKQKKKGWWNQ